MRSIYEEEGLPAGPDLESQLASLPVVRMFQCGGDCPKLIQFGAAPPGPCPVCGRRLEEVKVEWREMELPKEVNDEFAAGAQMRYAATCLKERRFAEAEKSLTRAIFLRPGDEDAYHNRAQARNGLNKFAEAIADCDEVMRINPRGADTLVTRAGLKAQIADPAGAIADATAALAMGTKKVFAYFVRGMCKMQTGNAAEGRADLERYLELAPTDPRSAVVRRILGHD
jgi:tetratricopeptide (TPR) repeat protein